MSVLSYRRIGTLDDLQDRDDLLLLTNSQDVDAVLQSIGWPSILDHDPPDIGGLLVSVDDGCYAEIYGFPGNLPVRHASVYRIRHRFLTF